jgi:hypothetical protein
MQGVGPSKGRVLLSPRGYAADDEVVNEHDGEGIVERSPAYAHRERGSPRTRSARMFRWISEVPAKSEAAR